jgi:hypothetical protein
MLPANIKIKTGRTIPYYIGSIYRCDYMICHLYHNPDPTLSLGKKLHIIVIVQSMTERIRIIIPLATDDYI